MTGAGRLMCWGACLVLCGAFWTVVALLIIEAAR